MTLPRERTNAVNRAREFLRSLLNPKETPRVPRAIRKEAYWALRHYPSEWDMERVCKTKQDIFDGSRHEEED